jgi:hypothetical protein
MQKSTPTRLKSSSGRQYVQQKADVEPGRLLASVVRIMNEVLELEGVAAPWASDCKKSWFSSTNYVLAMKHYWRCKENMMPY